MTTAQFADVLLQECIVRDFARYVFTVVFMVTLLAVIASFAGITPDGILYGHGPGCDDHPTNWDDSVLHP